MFKYRISKYNPKFRNKEGVYTRNEWTAYSDIGEKFDDGILTETKYLKVEKFYIDFIYSFFKSQDISSVRIVGQEPEKIFQKTTFEIGDDWLFTIIQKEIREQFWCKFKAEDFELYMGDDFYLHIDSKINVEKEINEMAKKYNLYFEVL